MFRHKIITTLAAAGLAAGVTTATIEPSEANPVAVGAVVAIGLAAGALGLALGSAFAQHNTYTTVQPTTETVVDTHAARCQARYRTYDPSSDTYVGSGGAMRRCLL